jgi:hypothetical protein
MLVQPIIDKLGSMKLAGMGEGLREQMENPAYRKLSFEERLGLLLDKESQTPDVLEILIIWDGVGVLAGLVTIMFLSKVYKRRILAGAEYEK